MTKAKRYAATPSRPETVTISAVELDALQVKAEVCDSYTRVLASSDPLAKRRLADALYELSLIRDYH